MKNHESAKSELHKLESTKRPPAGEKTEVICEYCNQNFNGSKYRYERHLIFMHENQLGPLFQCDICSKKFISFNSMRMHMEVHKKRLKEKDYPFKCGQCVMRFLDEEKLKIHV